jgi:hypothetical protein
MAEHISHKQHFTFEMYAPTSISESFIPIVERTSLQIQGDDLPIYDVIWKFEDFLKACGYSACLEGKRLDIVGKND